MTMLSDLNVFLIILLVLFLLALTILCIAAYWKIFEKAGQPGWKALIPIYNVITLLRIINNSPWLVLLIFIPGIVNSIFYIYINAVLGKKFNKSTAFTFGLIFLPIIFLPILGFGDSKYHGESIVTDNEMLLDSNL